MSMVYPYAGANLDTVCASLRLNNQKTELVLQLAQMATSVLLTLQKLQAQKPQVGLSGARLQLVGVQPGGGAAQVARLTVQHSARLQTDCLQVSLLSIALGCFPGQPYS